MAGTRQVMYMPSSGVIVMFIKIPLSLSLRTKFNTLFSLTTDWLLAMSSYLSRAAVIINSAYKTCMCAHYMHGHMLAYPTLLPTETYDIVL